MFTGENNVSRRISSSILESWAGCYSYWFLYGIFILLFACFSWATKQKKDWFQWSIDTYTKQLAMTENMFIRILSIVNIILQIHDAELWQQLRLRRPQSWICYLTYVHLESSSQLNLSLINNKFNYLEH